MSLRKYLNKIYLILIRIRSRSKINPKIKSIYIITLLFLGCLFKFEQFSFTNEALCRAVSYEDIFGEYQEDSNLIEYLQENVLKRSPQLNYRLMQPFMKDFSQFSQGIFIEEFLKKKKNGTFIEAGALDGEIYSNTLLFERLHKWTGLLVEPNPVSFGKLIQKGRKAQAAECCLSTTPFHNKALISIDEEYSSIVNSTQNNRPVVRQADVDCYPLYSLMVATNLTTVDLLVLDMEGVELEVLKTLPWDKIDVKSILIEYKHIPEGKEYLATFLKEKNYQLVSELEIDYFFVKN